jgi:transposase
VEETLSLHPEPIGEIPSETAQVARSAFPKSSVVIRLRDEFGELYRDEHFRSLYPRRGQPGLAPWRLALVTVFQFLEHLSDRQAADAVRARIDWKYALGLELTDPGFHFSVLTEFRARLVAGGAEHLLLSRMLEHFRSRGLVRVRGKQRTDSTHVLAAVRHLNLLELMVETLRAALDDLAAVVPDWLRGVAQPAWFERYRRRAEDYRLPKSQEAREAFAHEVGADGFGLLEALDASTALAAARQLPKVRTLRDVWQVHYVREDDGKLRWRVAGELPTGAERIQSPHDREARFSMKRHLSWTGYKVHVTEACDNDTAHLIVHVETCPSTRPDMASTAEIHARLATKDLLPSEHFVDGGYVDAGLLDGSRRAHGISLEGPVRGTSSRPARTGQGYGLPSFTIDWDSERATCPQGKTSVSWRRETIRGGEVRICAQFSRQDCGPCPARVLCAPKTAARRSIHFHLREEFEALNAARARMNDPTWQERYHRRAGVEGTLSQGVRAFGMRKSRYIGLAKTALQQVCTAVGMNVVRIVHWLDGLPRARTRVTRFAALASAA